MTRLRCQIRLAPFIHSHRNANIAGSNKTWGKLGRTNQNTLTDTTPFPMWPGPDYTDDYVLNMLHTYPNLILWMAGHRHRECVDAAAQSQRRSYAGLLGGGDLLAARIIRSSSGLSTSAHADNRFDLHPRISAWRTSLRPCMSNRSVEELRDRAGSPVVRR